MKTILITGSTDGIGKLAAIKLAKDKHRIILHGRNADKLNDTILALKKASNNDNVTGYIADLSDFNAIEKMALEVSKDFTKIDILINNAGVFNSPNSKTENNIDIRFVVNYLAPYILTNKLVPLLKNSASPRIINLSSAAQSTVSLAALVGDETLSTQEAYAQSKLALTIWSFHLSRTLGFANVIAVNPGSLLDTKMAQEAYGHHWSSADKGANILYDLASSEKYTQSTGKYFDNDKGGFGDAHSDAYDEQKTNQLISLTDSILKL